jgi:hypothetical protein
MPVSDSGPVYNIKDLPEVFNIEPVDLFIVETVNGTSVVSFDNIIIDLEQTSFETEFDKHTTDILTLSSDINSALEAAAGEDVLNEIEALNNEVDVLEAELEAIFNNASVGTISSADIDLVTVAVKTPDVFDRALWESSYTITIADYFDSSSGYSVENVRGVYVQVFSSQDSTGGDDAIVPREPPSGFYYNDWNPYTYYSYDFTSSYRFPDGVLRGIYSMRQDAPSNTYRTLDRYRKVVLLPIKKGQSDFEIEIDAEVQASPTLGKMAVTPLLWEVLTTVTDPVSSSPL